MNTALRILLAAVAVSLAGCASYRGGTDDNNYNYGTGSEMRASPTFRPGMNPEDPRDAVGPTLPDQPAAR